MIAATLLFIRMFFSSPLPPPTPPLFIYSVASQIPFAPTANCASASANVGLSKTVQMRFSPLPFLSLNLVVLAWAMMLPPMALVESLAKLIPPGSAVTWLVMKTATPNSSASLCLSMRLLV